MPCLGLGLSIAARRPLLAGDGLGIELISNGGFDSDTVWTKGAGWSIAGGVGARAFNVSSGVISQPVSFVAGRSYSVTWTLLGFVSGVFAPRFQGGTVRTGTTRSANGRYTEVLLANAGNVTFEIIGGGGAEGNVDNVSVREVL
jgi:hypothetical protein